MAIINPMVDIFTVTVFLVVASKYMQNKFMDKDQMKEHKEETKTKSEKVKELLKKKDPKSLKEAEKIQNEIMESSMKVMQGSMRYMMYSLPMVMIVFFLLGQAYEKEIITLPIALPWWTAGNFLDITTWFDFKMFEQTNWFGWYFVSYLSTSIVYGIVQKTITKIRGEIK